MQRSHILHHDTEQHGNHRQPLPLPALPDELHIERCHRVEHHHSRDKPKLPGIALPEAPVDADIEQQLPQIGTLPATTHIIGDIESTCHHKPRGVDAHIATHKEMTDAAVFREREPKTYPTEEKEHIHSYIAAAHHSIRQTAILPATHVEEHHENHGQSHQCCAPLAQHLPLHRFGMHQLAA